MMLGPIVGLDVAGVVSEVAEDSTSPFKVGDEVFGTCRGSLADRACVKSSRLGHKPKRLSFAQAAAMPTTYLTSLQGFRGPVCMYQSVDFEFARKTLSYPHAQITDICLRAGVL